MDFALKRRMEQNQLGTSSLYEGKKDVSVVGFVWRTRVYYIDSNTAVFDKIFFTQYTVRRQFFSNLGSLLRISSC